MAQDYTLIFQKLGITELNELQKEAMERFPEGSDMLILSPTGSGKTLAFLLPLVEKIDVTSDRVQAVIITPSRELALQIDGVVKQMKCGVRSVSCYGGRAAMDEHRIMDGILPHIVIATPGRLVDHLQKDNFDASDVETLVIDEYDKCLEFGFEKEMSEAFSLLPSVRQKVLCSATSAVNLKLPVILDYLRNEEETESRISLHVVHSPIKDKLETLICLLRCFGQKQTIVFLNYRDAVERTYNFLKMEGVQCEMFHGAMDQERRERSIYKFSNGTSNVLVSTDLASRGLDFPDIDNVIHYHLPLNEEAYIHRNGRTARWEAEGNSYFLINEEERVPEYVVEKNGELPEFFIPKNLPPVKPSIWATLYIGKGKKDKISKVDVLGTLCKIGGLSTKEVGRIDVREHQSFAAIHRDKLQDVLTRLKGQKIKGIKTLFVEAR